MSDTKKKKRGKSDLSDDYLLKGFNIVNIVLFVTRYDNM